MLVAVYGTDTGFAQRLGIAVGQMGLEQLHTGFHSTGCDQNFGNIHLVGFELFTDHGHCGKESVIQNLTSRDPFFKSLCSQCFYILNFTCLHLQRQLFQNSVHI